MWADVGDINRSRGGICKDRRERNAGLLGVEGLSWRSESSFEERFVFSLNLGDGERLGGPVSDKDLVFDGDRNSFLPPTSTADD